MLSTAHIALCAMAYLSAKHMLADFVLQSPYQLQNKGRYMHPGGLLHAAIHCGLSLPVYAIVRADLHSALLLTLMEFFIHYHLDWSKEQLTRCRQLTQADVAFWWAFGTDQMLHALTYVAMVGMLVH